MEAYKDSIVLEEAEAMWQLCSQIAREVGFVLGRPEAGVCVVKDANGTKLMYHRNLECIQWWLIGYREKARSDESI